MNAATNPTPAPPPGILAAEHLLAADDVPWIPLSGGKSFKPLRFLREDRGFVELLRLEPGETIGWHRHTGEVHAFNIAGKRRLRDGREVASGGYVHEPAGNVDTWQAIGDEALIVFVVVFGAVEYVDEHGATTARYTATSLRALYCEHCAAHGIEAPDLDE